MESKLYMQLVLWGRGVPWDPDNEVDCTFVKNSQLPENISIYFVVNRLLCWVIWESNISFKNDGKVRHVA